MLESELHPEADRELEAAYRWYLKRSPQAAAKFLEGVEQAIGQAARFPDRWQSYLHGTRLYRVVDYPYALVYRREANRIFGVAVAHLHRRPGYWKNRTD